MVDSTIMRDIATVARELRVEAAALAAVADLESGLRPHAMIDNRAEPLIRFEGHYFDRRLSGAAQAEARRKGLAAPQAGSVKNPASQAARWQLLASAVAINRKAAYESTSWGMGQVMGAHWAWLGYASIEALVAQARTGAIGQLRLMACYIDKAGLADTLRKHDWAGFARSYNGPGFAKNNYDDKLARAYARYAAGGFAPSAPATGSLRRGSRGEAVHLLQLALIAAGHPLAGDGIFGPATEQAVRAFQTRNRLIIDGIAGPATMAALGSGQDRGLWQWLLAWFAGLRASLPGG